MAVVVGPKFWPLRGSIIGHRWQWGSSCWLLTVLQVIWLRTKPGVSALNEFVTGVEQSSKRTGMEREYCERVKSNQQHQESSFPECATIAECD